MTADLSTKLSTAISTGTLASEPVVMAAKFALGRHRFNPLRQTRNRRYRALGVTGKSTMTSTPRLDAVSRRYLHTDLAGTDIGRCQKNLTSNSHPDIIGPNYEFSRRGQGSRRPRPWGPPSITAVHVLGSEIHIRVSGGCRFGAGVRGPAPDVRQPASGSRRPQSGVRLPGVQRPQSGVRLWVSASEL